MKFAIVTDSTCDLPLETLAALDVHLVPLYVFFGEEAYLDQVEIEVEDFYDRLPTVKELPTTSQPSPAEFQKMYDSLAAQGYEGILSIHISSPLSGTCNSAELAAKSTSIPVVIIDTKTTTHKMALMVQEAVRLRDAGVGLLETSQRIGEFKSKTELYFIVDTMENLVRGGRAGKAAGLAAGLLNIKPILTLNEEGTIEPFAKARGTKAAIDKLTDAMAQRAEEAGPLYATVFHTRNDAGVEQLKKAAEAKNIPVTYSEDGKIGPVVATHLGLGALGVTFYPVSASRS